MIGSGAVRSVGRAVGERAAGIGPGPFRAAFVAVITGSATAALTYRALRSDSLADAFNTNKEDA